MAVDRALIDALRAGLAAAGDPGKAAQMQAYMKSDQSFRGVPAPQRRALTRAAFAAHPLGCRDDWAGTVRALWNEAEYREERYAAVELTGVRAAGDWQDPDTVALYDHLIVSGAWWDFVDELAIRRVGPILRSHPTQLAPVLRRWAVDADRWRRRSAVIAQVGAKHETDTDLLAATIDANLDDPDFFLRKGIGWALREYAKTDPAWVRAFVAARTERISGLSRREALKHIGA